MSSYAVARDYLVAALTRDAAAHEAGRYREIGGGFDRTPDFDAIDAERPRGEGPGARRLRLAIDFWGGWIDARNHGWRYYEPIREADWPALARRVAADLAADRDVTDPVVLAHFGPASRRPLLECVRSGLSRLGR